MFYRAVSTSAIRYAKRPPIITKFPVTLHIIYPPNSEPLFHEFSSMSEITNFLEPKQFLTNIETNKAIRRSQVHDIDPNVIYEIRGPGIPYRENGLSKEQVWDMVFKRKTTQALEKVLEEDDPGAIKLPRVIRNAEGKEVALAEWEAIYQLSDGCIVFLKTKYGMSKTHVDGQLECMSKSLIAIGKSKRARLYLAAYYWPDEDCISNARNQGYGTIQPNGSDFTVHFRAKELQVE